VPRQVPLLPYHSLQTPFHVDLLLSPHTHPRTCVTTPSATPSSTRKSHACCHSSQSLLACHEPLHPLPTSHSSLYYKLSTETNSRTKNSIPEPYMPAPTRLNLPLFIAPDTYRSYPVLSQQVGPTAGVSYSSVTDVIPSGLFAHYAPMSALE
jgi:hypothetical protein